jgi:hypothetical protein
MRWIVTWPISVLLVVSAPALGSPTQPSSLPSSAKVVRDDHGIPHIFAKTERDLYFLTGWIHAQDRFFQMDAARRRASGTLAELLGPDALGGDVESRNLGIRRAAERSLAQLSQPVQKGECPGRCCKWMGVAQVDNYAASPRLARLEWSARVVARAAFRASRASLSFGNCL